MTTKDILFLKKLSEAFGPSGMEDEVRDLLFKEIYPFVDRIRIDNMGNLVAEKGDHKKLAICAHMDEVGFMITQILENGTLRFSAVGGISPSALPSKKVIIGQNRILGIIGAKPIHLTKNDKDKKDLSFSDLFISIGAASKAEAEERISLGDFAVFDTDFAVSVNEKSVFGKALDNRIGCFLLKKLICSEKIKNASFVFTVQEETGLRGAEAFSNNSNYDFAIALDTTTANDLPNITIPQSVCFLKKGPVISYIDGATVYNRDLVNDAFSLLKSNGIQAQTKMRRAGGNDASVLQKRGSGHLVLSLSVPCRYIHGPLGLTTVFDIEESYKALELLAKKHSNRENKND